jgi:hypothetical protein
MPTINFEWLANRFNVCCGSLADILTRSRHVRFTPRQRTFVTVFSDYLRVRSGVEVLDASAQKVDGFRVGKIDDGAGFLLRFEFYSDRREAEVSPDNQMAELVSDCFLDRDIFKHGTVPARQISFG